MLQSLTSTFGWSVCSIQFLNQGELVATYNVSKIKDKIFALPHADSLGLSITQSHISQSPILPFSPSLTLPLSPSPRLPLSPSPPLPLSPSPPSSLELISELFPYSGLYDDIKAGITTKTIELSDEALLNRIKETSPVKDIQIRSTLPFLNYRISHKVISTLSLEGGYERVITGLNPNVRRKINKAQKNGILIKAGNTELLDDFYTIYRNNIHKHGSFGLPKAYFSNLSPEDSMLFVAYLDNKPIGSALLTWLMDTSENISFATLPEYNQLYPSYALHDAMISASVFLGCRTYSMGRCTPGSPVHKYKQQWGTVDKVLYYNSSIPVSDKISRFKFIRPVLRILPQWVVERFDYFVAKRIY